jgi:hypothetical protein
MTACAGPIAIESPVNVFTTGLVFVQMNVLAFTLTRYLEAMMSKECFCQSLKATFGRARC